MNAPHLPEAKRPEPQDNGQANELRFVVAMIRRLAHANQATAFVQTLHHDGCKLLKGTGSEALAGPYLAEEEKAEHLYACTCDLKISAVLHKDEDKRNTLMISSCLSEIKERLPWLEDEQLVLAMLEIGSQTKEALVLFGSLAFDLFDGPMGHTFRKIPVGPRMLGLDTHFKHLRCDN